MSKVEIVAPHITGIGSGIYIDGVKQEKVVSMTFEMCVGEVNRLYIKQFPESMDINAEAIVEKSHVNYLTHPDSSFVGAPKDSVRGQIVELLIKQTEKGLSKYGHTLDDCPDEKFDWRLMAMEELIDLAQYQQKEIMRLERLLNP